MKTCTKCEAEKSLDAFYLRTDGYRSSACRPCTVERTRQWREAKGPEYRKKEYQSRSERRGAEDRQRVRDWYRAQRSAVLSLLGGQCRGCGCSDERLLQVDHVNNDGAAERREISDYRAIYRKILKEQDTENYQALCANCHVLKTYHGVTF